MAISLEEARAAKEKAKTLFADNVGVGITRAADGYAIKVNLAAPAASLANTAILIDGVPVQFEVVGQIRKQGL